MVIVGVDDVISDVTRRVRSISNVDRAAVVTCGLIATPQPVDRR